MDQPVHPVTAPHFGGLDGASTLQVVGSKSQPIMLKKTG